jgi:hypothetical protein
VNPTWRDNELSNINTCGEVHEEYEKASRAWHPSHLLTHSRDELAKNPE